jgi:prephenate dehydratase
MQLPAPSFIKLILDSNEDHRTRFLVSKKKKRYKKKKKKRTLLCFLVF